MGNERLHYRSPNINVCLKVKVKGNFKDEQFKNAITDICKKHPILTCVLQTDEKNNVWYIPNKVKPSIEIYENIEWQQWYQKEDEKPFDFINGPLAKFCVVRNVESINIVIIGHHIIGDGIGFLNLMRDFLLALDGKVTAIEYIANNALKDKSRLGFLASAFTKKLNKCWQNTSKRFTEQEYIDFFYTYRKSNKAYMFLETLDNGQLSKLISKCKEIGITVNEAISVAFVKALLESEHYKNDKIKLGIAANIRGEMVTPTSHTMGNYTTGISVLVSFDDNKSFAENSRAIKKMLVKKLNIPKNRYQVIHFLNELNKSFLDAVPFAAYGKFNNPNAKKLAKILGETADNKGMGISNLGIQSLGEFNSFAVDSVLFIPPAFPANLINIGVITENNQLHFCIRYSETDISDVEVKKIVAEAKKLLIK